MVKIKGRERLAIQSIKTLLSVTPFDEQRKDVSTFIKAAIICRVPEPYDQNLDRWSSRHRSTTTIPMVKTVFEKKLKKKYTGN